MREQLDDGTLYVTPCELNAEVAELLRDRYGLPMWRFTNSGTEATMDAVRVARGATGRDKVVKVEGGYHGHNDELMISMKPPLDEAGPADAPRSVPATAGITSGVVADTVVVPYNDPDALERVLGRGDVACFILEPVMENIGICLPDPGYLEAVRQLTTAHGSLLIFDEVKTGITAGYGGATGHFGIEPDLVTLAKSIGGGFPVGAFGGKQEYMDLITAGKVLHLGTYNGNPLVMAAAQGDALRGLLPRADRGGDRTQWPARRGVPEGHRRRRAPCPHRAVRGQGLRHVVHPAGPQLPRLQGDRLRPGVRAVDPRHQSRRAAAPGLDEQWLISVMHSDDEADRYAGVLAEFAAELQA